MELTEVTENVEKPTDSSKPGTSCMIGEYVPDPESCKNYFRCVLGELQREQCAPGLHWDARRSICDWPAAAKCQVETGKTALSSIYIYVCSSEKHFFNLKNKKHWIFFLCNNYVIVSYLLHITLNSFY